MVGFFHRGLSLHLQRAHAGRTQADAPTHHAFGTFGTSPACAGFGAKSEWRQVMRDVRRKMPLDATHAITHASLMQTVTATTARSMIYKLLDDASDSHEPIQITGKRSSAVLVAEDDWRAIQESLYLVSIPGMRESIRSGLATPVAACAKKLDW